MALQHPDVECLSICCDSLDGAREILECSKERAWPALSHYFMAYDDKEIAKQVLGFRSVPYYLVVDETGDLVHAGKTFSWDDVSLVSTPAISTQTNPKEMASPRSPRSSILVIDDLDF